jgi:CspA family cold shock protein
MFCNLRSKRIDEASSGVKGVQMASDFVPRPAQSVVSSAEYKTNNVFLEEGAGAPVEITGYIKWFDVAKGFGFVVPDQGGADVLLHVSCLRRDGYQTAAEGARVVCTAVAGKRGMQVLKIHSMDTTTAVHPSDLPPPRAHVSVVPTSPLERMTVKWFNRIRGFGFANAGEGKPDIFLHMEILRQFGFADLKPGQEILVRYGPGSKGLMAAEVRPVDGQQIPVSN